VSVANYFTLLRIVISPIFLFVYLEHAALGISNLMLPYILLLLMSICEFTDAFDGYLARKFNQVTDLGKILDPMADSIARISYFLTFTLDPVRLPMLLIFVFIYRDSVVSTLRTVCALQGFALAARKSGKIKAVIQAIAAFSVLLMMIPYSLGNISESTLQTASLIAVSIAAIYTLYSAGDYIIANGRFIRQGLQPKRNPSSSS